ncbi:hypothetical protein MSG28_000605 [Choristoneura fumiferana]|uniref:Uncharacterized protein n=1 Tax=Choristoneura fumiferana TaxID=7141 RepID=A0ACC0K230_CHOFU|nr:hypothetical protein MSG28_000605 [Choristoneura fumiferana]
MTLWITTKHNKLLLFTEHDTGTYAEIIETNEFEFGIHTKAHKEPKLNKDILTLTDFELEKIKKIKTHAFDLSITPMTDEKKTQNHKPKQMEKNPMLQP